MTEKRPSAKRVDDIARTRTGLGQILRRAEAYAALNRRVGQLIPESARHEIAIACVDGECLIIATASSARASQARLLADSLLETARQHWPEKLSSTRVIVAPGLNMES